MSFSNAASKLIALLLLILVVFGCEKNKNLQWTEEEGYSWAEVNREFQFFDQQGFELLSSSETGIDLTNTVTPEQVSSNRVLINGSGVATGDIDGDGLADIYFCSINGSNKLYKNNGDWSFTDIAEKAGVEMQGYKSSGVAFADVDNDNDLDLIVTTIGGGNKLFINDGKGNFSERVNALRATEKYGSHSIAIADIEKDGDLDIYIANYKARSAKDIYPDERSYGSIVKKEGNEFSIYPKFKDHYRLEERGDFVLWFEMGEHDLLYLNDGKGNFKNITDKPGTFFSAGGSDILLSDLKDWGLHAKFFDFNNDLYPDLYVSNDFESPDRIWINDRDGTFREIDSTAVRHTSLSSMSVDFADIDRDGFSDFFVAEMLAKDRQTQKRHLGTMIPLPEPVGVINNRPQYVGNTLMLNRGDHTFAGITDYAGVRASDWTWGTVFSDVDLDGYEDVILTNGNFYDSQDLDANNKLQNLIRTGQIDPRNVMLEYPGLKQENVIFKNNGDLTFTDKSSEWGFNQEDISQGIAMADFDRDGDLDMVINKLNAPSAIYENKTTADRIAVQLVGDSINKHAIGSKLEIITRQMPQYKEVTASGSYLSDSDMVYSFAAPGDSATIRITWNDGKISTITGIKKNRIYKFYKEDLDVEGIYEKEEVQDQSTYFADVSNMLDYEHTEKYFDDYDEYQPSLPYRLSQTGPGLSWYDFNKDGYDDLLIGDGKDGNLSVFQNEDGVSFSTANLGYDSLPLKNDASSVLAFSDNEFSYIFRGSFNYEALLDTSFVHLSRFSDSDRFDSKSIDLPEQVAVGPMAAADYDKDGDLDLFVGGRVKAKRYPAPVSSWFLKNIDGEFTVDTENSMSNLGLVTGAVFSDINMDGWPDLLLAREWNSIIVLINDRGNFIDSSSQWGLDSYKGLWNGITTGDFNNDGLMDFIVANAGKNNEYSHLLKETGSDIRLFYYPRENIGTSIIESYYSDELDGWVPKRRLTDLAKEFSVVRSRINSHKQFSELTIEEILGVGLDNFNSVSANTFSTSLFLNIGDSFKKIDLPKETQLTNAQGVNVLDFNSDGNEDIFISQNFFNSIVEQPRSDAGRGLLLQGSGTGEFRAIPGHESGIKVYGEQRAAGISDFNLDGKVDIVVTQNGSTSKLYENISAGRGVIVKLEGTEYNPDAIGAKLRFIYRDDSKGPIREIKAGSGYLSQNSVTQVLGYDTYPKALSIEWPNGGTSRIVLPANLLSITINSEGKIVSSLPEN